MNYLAPKDVKGLFPALGKNKIYQLMHDNTFPSIKLGGRYYVKRDDLEDWLKKQTRRK